MYLLLSDFLYVMLCSLLVCYFRLIDLIVFLCYSLFLLLSVIVPFLSLPFPVLSSSLCDVCVHCTSDMLVCCLIARAATHECHSAMQAVS